MLQVGGAGSWDEILSREENVHWLIRWLSDGTTNIETLNICSKRFPTEKNKIISFFNIVFASGTTDIAPDDSNGAAVRTTYSHASNLIARYKLSMYKGERINANLPLYFG